WLSGALGDASLALAHHAGRVVLTADEAAACWNALLRPAPRVALGIQLRGIASAAIDVSDGLVGDLGHVLEASKVGAVLELASIPRSKALDRQLASSAHDIALQCLLAGGDDYELCFTAAPAHDRRVVTLAIELGLELHRVGTIAAEVGLVVQDSSGPLLPLPQAYDHFAA
ncbi:MAG: thiamine-phosphate kinase, partial [Betaproteobacteria bacterium]